MLFISAFAFGQSTSITSVYKFQLGIQLREMTAPSTPSTNWFAVYAKSDGKIYGKNDAGTEYDLTAGSGGTVTSVGLTVPSLLSVSGSPITTSGTFGITWDVDDRQLIFGADGNASQSPNMQYYWEDDSRLEMTGGGYFSVTDGIESAVLRKEDLAFGLLGSTSSMQITRTSIINTTTSGGSYTLQKEDGTTDYTITLPNEAPADGEFLQFVSGTDWDWAVPSGTVASFSSGNLSPLFTTSVTNPTTTPALSFTLSNAGANTWFGNNTGSSAAPAYNSAGTVTKADDTNVTLTLGGTPTNSVLNSFSITAGWTGTLSTSRGGWGGSASATSPLSLSSGTLSLPITDNYVLFGTGTSVQGDADFTFDDSNNHLSIGGSWVAMGGTNTENFNLHLQEDGRVELVGSGYSSSKTVFAIRRANGTMSSPSAILNNEIIGDLSWGGYKSTAWSTSSVAAIQAMATEDFDDSGTGTKLNLQVTPNNSTGVVTAVTIDQDSKIILENKIKEYNNAAPADGQLLIGNTAGGTFDAATLTEGSAIDITNGAGSITILHDLNELTTDDSYDYDDDYIEYYDAGEAANNKIVLGTLTRYALLVQADVSNPADAATTYLGNMPRVPISTEGISRIYMSEAGTITAADIFVYAGGTSGSNEAWSFYVRVNSTTDHLIETVSASTAARRFDNTSLAISLSAGDYFEIKMVNPTWATNPTNVIIGGNVLVK